MFDLTFKFYDEKSRHNRPRVYNIFFYNSDYPTMLQQ